MQNVRTIKRHIKSVSDIHHVAKAMKMVAAARLKKAQERVEKSRPFARKISEVLVDLSSLSLDPPHPLLEVRPPRRVGILVIGSDHGLCGRYNDDIIAESEKLLARMSARIREAAGHEAAHTGQHGAGSPAGAGADSRASAAADFASHEPGCFVIPVGKEIYDHFKAKGVPLLAPKAGLSLRPTFSSAEKLARLVTGLVYSGKLNHVYLVYSRFYSPLEQRPRVFRLIPVVPADIQIGQDYAHKKTSPDLWIFEPGPRELLDHLIPRYLEAAIYRALLEADASEKGARMTAMGAATDNAEELLARLSLDYHRSRQAVITRELIEITSGAQAQTAEAERITEGAQARRERRNIRVSGREVAR